MGLINHVTSVLKKTGVVEIDQGQKTLDNKIDASVTIQTRRIKDKDGNVTVGTSFRPTDGVFLQDIDVVSGNNKIIHGLKRPALGYIVVNTNIVLHTYNNTPLNDDSFDPKQYIRINCTANAKISVWIF